MIKYVKEKLALFFLLTCMIETCCINPCGGLRLSQGVGCVTPEQSTRYSGRKGEQFNSRVDSLFIVIVVCDGQLGGESVHRPGHAGHSLPLLGVVDDLLLLSPVLLLAAEAPDDEGLRIGLDNTLERERFSWRTAEDGEAGEDAGRD